MKILIIHNKYGVFSGEEAVVNFQISLLEKNGHVVKTFFRESEEINSGVFGKINAFFSGFLNIRSLKSLLKMVEEFNPDIIHIHNLYPLISPSVLYFLKKKGFPLFMTVHNYRLICPNGLFFDGNEICEKCFDGKEYNCIFNNCEQNFFKSFGYSVRNIFARKLKLYSKNIDGFLCLTDFQKQKLIKGGFDAKKCHVIPNAIEMIPEKENDEIVTKDYVAFAGRVSREKGINLLIKVAERTPEICFKIAGAKDELFFKELKIPDNVKFLGRLNSTEIKTFYKEARLFVLPSIWYEGFPIVLLEAMKYSLPIIAPNMAGYPEVLQDGVNGYLFEPRSVDSLREKILKIYYHSNCKDVYGIKGKDIAHQYFSSQNYYKRLIHSYEFDVNK